MPKKRFLSSLGAFVVFCCIISINQLVLARASNSEQIKGSAVITDGDTIKIGEYRIRLYGIDAPERSQSCRLKKNPQWRCGEDSKAFLKALISDKAVLCDIMDVDRYKRIVAECFVDDRNINEVMVRQGWAINYDKYSDKYIWAEEEAMSEKRGIWSSEFIAPWAYRSYRRKTPKGK